MENVRRFFFFFGGGVDLVAGGVAFSCYRRGAKKPSPLLAVRGELEVRRGAKRGETRRKGAKTSLGSRT